MLLADESLDRWLEGSRLTPPEINALLFYRLGQFVIWGRRHQHLAAGDEDFSRLLDEAVQALSHGGVLEKLEAPLQ